MDKDTKDGQGRNGWFKIEWMVKHSMHCQDFHLDSGFFYDPIQEQLDKTSILQTPLDSKKGNQNQKMPNNLFENAFRLRYH